MITTPLLPPPLVHQLRARSFARLYRMTGNPGNRGFGRVLRQRIHTIVRRERHLVEKAITVAYLGSYLTDHIIFAEKEAARLLEGRELTEREEHELWEQNYGSVIAKILAELPDGEAIREEMTLLDRYTRLPEPVYAMRNRHWRHLQAILRHGPADAEGNISGIPIVTRVHDVLTSGRPLHRKAFGVCLAASLLADVECWNSHRPWPEAYEHVMTELYPLLQRYPEVLEEIIRL
ncbi:MAG: hypothetical protein NZ740_01355 [Kiritimatiellae bacterium]|nr:hypothetical protein [Kiritimatiellia bacterium]MDW8457738.1 hypothetical protein [Verrucomicrobiota bacterium]